jgi:hypothetical protein
MTWNSKKNFINFNKENSIFHYGADNDESMSSIFNSFYTPFYDSGCAILSNTPPTSKHFIPFNHHSNRGILYAFYETFNVLVITISTDKATLEEVQKLLSTYYTLSTQYQLATIYIIADFKSEIICNEDIIMLLSPIFRIQLIEDGLSKTTYLLHTHNYTFDSKENNKILKPNTIISSPNPFTKQTRTSDCYETIMEEEKKLHLIIENNESLPPTPSTTPPPPPTPVDKTSPSSSSSFPFIIFNYFSSNKTPPSSSPTTQTPAQSPKSDGSWSQV